MTRLSRCTTETQKASLTCLSLHRKYLPLLKKFPAEYIYEPWKAPRSVQQAAGCIVGKDYPQPIVKHEEIHKKNIQRMKLAYAKRSSDAAVSPNKKQGMTENIRLNLFIFQCLLWKKQFNVFYHFCLFLTGLKRKASSVADLLQSKGKKK